MRAILWTNYGPPEVLQVGEAAQPRPKERQLLVKVAAAAVTTGDCEMRSLRFPYWIRIPMRLFVGLRKPTRIPIPGAYFAGDVAEVGPAVTEFKPGDAVYGTAVMGFGAYAEYVCVDAGGAIAVKPANLSYEEAASVPLGGLEALHFLRIGNLQRGEKVLINGAGGGIGTFGIQLAKEWGAEVTAVDKGEKLEMLRGIGADHLIDYAKEDFTQNGQRYDIIFDVIGKSPFARSIQSLAEGGRYLIANPSGLIQFARGKWAARTTGKQVLFEMTSPKGEDLRFLNDLMEAGKLRPVIDRRYPLEEVVEAHRYVESGRKQGSVVLTL